VVNDKKNMPVQKEEVVISGIGGVFPECDTLEELKNLLFNKTNAVTIDSRRWRPSTQLLFNFFFIINTTERIVTQLIIFDLHILIGSKFQYKLLCSTF